MRRRLPFWLALGAALCGTLLARGVFDRGPLLAHADEPATRARGVAVLELFTSQGCSSCPPADRLLGEIVAESAARPARGEEPARDALPVFALSFHVDYWDRLGWPDPFAQRQCTVRQYRYAEHFAKRTGERSVCTPQLVVNGRVGFVGSDRRRARQALKQALARPARAEVGLELERTGQRLSVAYEVSELKTEDPVVLQLAVTEAKARVKVPRGENGGRTLSHTNVVRHFQAVTLEKQAGSVTIDLPQGLGPGQVVAYVQSRKSLEILGASAAELPPAGAEAKQD